MLIKEQTITRNNRHSRYLSAFKIQFHSDVQMRYLKYYLRVSHLYKYRRQISRVKQNSTRIEEGREREKKG